MNLIGFNSQPPALLLANYLRKQGLAAEVVTGESNNEFVVAIVNEHDIDRAKEITEGFLREPNHPRYQDAAWESDEKVTLSTSSRGLTFKPSQLLSTPFTAFILIVCSLVYLASFLGAFPLVAHFLMILPWPELVESGQWWRVIGPAFLHFSVLHFVFNLLWWWTLGQQVESKFGSTYLLLFLLVTAAVSNLAQLFVSGPNFGGLSGVVYALMGFVWWIGWLRPSWGLSLPKPLVGFMLVWLVLGYTDMLWVAMANTAHTIGLVGGCAFALITVQLTAKGKTQP